MMTGAILLCALAVGSASGIDNRCFVDRQCETDQDLINGYHAYENNQCVAPAQSQPSGGAPAQIDNCCFVDRQCQTDQDWMAGWHAYQNNQCPAPGAIAVRIASWNYSTKLMREFCAVTCSWC